MPPPSMFYQNFSLANPSWMDLWYFLSYAILISAYYILQRHFYKKNRKGIAWIFYFVGYIFNVIAVLPFYVLFLMLKPYGILKSILSLVIFSNSIPFGALTTIALIPTVLGWKQYTNKERLLAFVIGLCGFLICSLGFIAVDYLAPCVFQRN
jgi:hypothetical protein